MHSLLHIPGQALLAWSRGRLGLAWVRGQRLEARELWHLLAPQHHHLVVARDAVHVPEVANK